MVGVGGVPGGNFSITQKVWMEEHQDHEPQDMAAVCQHVFKEAEEKLEMSIEKESGEWLDKEPRADGKPRRWRPFEVREAREFISQTFQEYQTQHPLDDTQPRSGTR